MTDGIEVYEGDGSCPAIDAIAKREADVSKREAEVQKREEAVATKEKDLIRREMGVAQKAIGNPEEIDRLAALMELMRKIQEQQIATPPGGLRPWVQRNSPLIHPLTPGDGYERIGDAPSWTTGAPPTFGSSNVNANTVLTEGDREFIERMVSKHEGTIFTKPVDGGSISDAKTLMISGSMKQFEDMRDDVEKAMAERIKGIKP